MKQRCNECNKKQKLDLPPKVIEIVNEQKPAFFYKVIVPAEMGDDVENPIDGYNYRNVLLYFEASKAGYLFDSTAILVGMPAESNK